MPDFPLPIGCAGSEKLPQTRIRLVNCFNNAENQIIPFPGLTQLGSDQTNDGRAAFKWNGNLYMIFGDTIQKVTDVVAGTVTPIAGTVSGTSGVQVAFGFNDMVIVDPGGGIYTLNKSDVLTDISGNANFVPCADVTHIDGRFVYVPSSGDPAFFSDVGAAGTVQAASFFDAETLPDLNNVVFNFNNTLYIGGTDSFELFRNTGASPVPFQRLQGAALRFGFISALQEYVDTFLFIGREKDQDFGIYAIAPGQAIKISNLFIDEILSTYTLEQLQLAVPGRLKWLGYDIATFTLLNHSFGFLKGQWFLLDTVVSGVSGPWQGGYITEFNGKYYTASKENIGRFDSINTVFGNRITRIMDFGFKHPNNRRFSAQSFEVGVSQGFNASETSIALMTSRDNVLYGPAFYRSVGGLGNYQNKLVYNYPGGLGNYNGFMGIRLYTTENADFFIDSMYLNLR